MKRLDGICGYLSGTCVVNSCYNIGSIRGEKKIGGIVGMIGGNSIVEIKHCYNDGNINVNNAGGTGGIIGDNYQSQQIYISDCYNSKKGAISGQGNGSLGGIFGRTCDCEELIFENCYNLASISGSGNSGGICGRLGCDSTGQELNAKLYNTYNLGNISGTFTGGIVGVVDYDNQAITNVEIINAYNLGEISGSNRHGGIVGRVRNTDTVLNLKNVFNGGNVIGDSGKVGEIIGENWNNRSTIDAENTYYLSGHTNPVFAYGSPTSGTAQVLSLTDISVLNTYVNEYNTTNAEEEDFVALKNWGTNKNEQEIVYFTN